MECDDFRTELSESGRTNLAGSVRVRRANQRLEQAWVLAGPLNLAGVSLTVRHTHFGPGAYPRGRGVGMHEHAQVHFEYVVSGAFHFGADEQDEPLPPGRGLVVLPGQRHRWECTERGHMLGGLLDLVGQRREALLEHLIRARNAPLAIFDGARPAELFRQLLPLLASENEAPWQRERVGFLTGLFLAEVLTQAWPLDAWLRSDRAASREEYLCQRAREFMAANCGHPIRLGDIALEVGVSVRHLNRLYRRHQGESLGAALGRLRLEEARRLLLAEPDLPVKAVAYRCGFCSPAYFTACYRDRYGEPPTHSRGGAGG